MSKELPYFKFYTSEWLNGDITLESFETQGLFINLCANYWSKSGELTLSKSKKRFRGLEDNFKELIAEKFISVNIEDKIIIKFLDEQMGDRIVLSKTNSANGKLGGRPKKIIEPILKTPKELKPKKDTSTREDQFNKLWELYDYKKSKKRSLSLFLKLKNEDVEKIKKTIVAYINETKGTSYRKHLSTYLSNECWNDVTYEIKTPEINHHLGLATAEKVVALFNDTDLTLTIKKYKTNKANILIRLNEFLELKSDYKNGTTKKALEWFLNSLKFSLPTEVTDKEELERLSWNDLHKEAIVLNPSLKRLKRND